MPDCYGPERANYRIAKAKIDKMLASDRCGKIRPFLESVRGQMSARNVLSKKQFRAVIDCYNVWEAVRLGRGI